LLHVGYENFVSKDKISGIYVANSSPMKRIITQARTDRMLIDATRNKGTKSVIILSDGHVILSAIKPKTLAVERFADDGREQ